MLMLGAAAGAVLGVLWAGGALEDRKRRPLLGALVREVWAWEIRRNQERATVKWQVDRRKLRHLHGHPNKSARRPTSLGAPRVLLAEHDDVVEVGSWDALGRKR